MKTFDEVLSEFNRPDGITYTSKHSLLSTTH